MEAVDLTDIKQEGGNGSPFDSLFAESDEQGKATPEASSAENKTAEVAPSQEGVGEPKEPQAEKPVGTEEKPNIPDVNQPIPLNKDRRFKEIQAANRAMQERLEAMQSAHEKQLAELKGLVQGSQKTAPANTPPEAFKELFGEGNEHLWGKWQQLWPQQPNVDELKQQLFQELESKQQEQVKVQEQRLQWVTDQVDSLREEGLKFEKNELLAVLEKYAPTDANGVLDFKKGYELLQVLNANKPENKRKDARKKIAAQTSPQGAAEQVADDTIDIAKTRGKNWRDIVKF